MYGQREKNSFIYINVLDGALRTCRNKMVHLRNSEVIDGAPAEPSEFACRSPTSEPTCDLRELVMGARPGSEAMTDAAAVSGVIARVLIITRTTTTTTLGGKGRTGAG
jgi:hypothetical protein